MEKIQMHNLELTMLERLCLLFTPQSSLDIWLYVLGDLENNQWKDMGYTVNRGNISIWVVNSPYADIKLNECVFGGNRCPYVLRRTIRNYILENITK